MDECRIVDAAIVEVAGVTMVVAVRVPEADADKLDRWKAEAAGYRVLVTPPPCPFVVDWRVRETGQAGRVSGPFGDGPIGIVPAAPQP